MTINRRHIAIAGAGALGVAVFGAMAPAFAEASDEAAVNQAVEAFRKAMLTNDRAQLDALTASALSYGHSASYGNPAGKVESKTVFIEGAMKGTWKSIALSHQTVAIVGCNAVSRFVLTGENLRDGKPNSVNIGVLMVWLNDDGNWKLLARQSVNI